MAEIQSTPNLTAALLRLLNVAGTLLHRLLADDKQSQKAKVLAHISGRLALASEASNHLEGAFLDELVALCKWRTHTSIYWGVLQKELTIPANHTVDPKIWLCQESEKHANEGFLAYASCSAKERETLRYFGTKKSYEVAAIKNGPVPASDADNITEPDALENYPDFDTKDLYTALSEYPRCSMQQAIPLGFPRGNRNTLGQRRSTGYGSPDYSKHYRHHAHHATFRDIGEVYNHDSMPESDLKAKRQQYDDWKWMFIRTAELFEKTKVAQSDRVRIAVLDTGLDKSHPHIKMEIERVWVYDKSKRTFTKGASTNIVDTKGHGTHIVGLVLEYAHEADVFVADVDFDNEPNRDMIADAIVAAVKNKIDIISISVGFQQRVLGDAMERAIDYAKANNVLIFAAASNSGANAGRSWPARYDGVFAIHSTDTNGNPSGFNPTEFEGINFATVGEAVESSWPNHLSRSPAKLPNGKGLKGQDTKGGVDFSPDCSVEVKSGTSFATPIAASLAVFLLQYAKKNLEPKFVAQLKRYGTMQSVLKCLAGTKRGGFYYLTLRIHPDHLFGKENAEEIKRIIEAAINESG